LLRPLLEFCETVSFDIELMVLRETTNGGWVKVDWESTSSSDSEMNTYFGDRFLKPNPRKKDGSLMFHAPANMKPPVFGLIFQSHVWKEIQVIKEAGVYLNIISYIFILMFNFLFTAVSESESPPSFTRKFWHWP
jgi:hypothetical protein